VKKIPVVKTETRKVCRTITVCEDRCVMKKCYQTVQETHCRKHCVRLGHWECRESCGHGLFGGHGHNSCDPCCAPAPRTHRVWVHCPEYEERPYTVCRRVCVEVPTTVKVNVCKQVWEDVTCQVCTYQCVTEQRVEKYTCMVTRQVPCQTTRTVRVCVPYQETVTCCRMVVREKQVQVPVCQPSCCESTCCESRRHGLFRGGHGHRSSSCCDSGCH
jgi:hypothetical protein